MAPQQIAELLLIPLCLGFGIVAIVARVKGRLELGYGARGWTLAQFPIGFAVGAIAIGAIFAATIAFGGIRVEAIGGDLGPLAAILVYLVVLALIEEAAFRGLLTNGLRVVLRNSWLAVAVAAVLVGVPYFFATGAGVLSVISGILSGVMYGAAFLLTRRIWLGAGIRAAWNFVQGPILGFPVSGNVLLEDSVVKQESMGAGLLTGGEYGPEASLPGLVVRVLLIAVIVALIARRSRTPLDPLPLSARR